MELVTVQVATAADDGYQAADGYARLDNTAVAFVTKWGSYGSGDGQFNGPYGIAVAPDGSVYVDDAGNNRVQKFSATGTFVTKWGSTGSGDGQFNGPYGIAAAPDGSVYVTDLGNNRVQKFSATGTFVTKWGSYGSGDGQFNEPYGIAVAPDGSVYVTDYSNNRVQKFDVGEVRSSSATTPAGLLFRAVTIPAGGTATAAHLKVAVKSAFDAPNLTIRGQGGASSFDAGTVNDLSGRTKTTANVVWQATGLWGERDAGGLVSSPDISSVIQEIIDGTWASGDDLALYLVDRGLGGDLGFVPYEFNPALAAELVVEWGAGFGWPEDYWSSGYWSEYWPVLLLDESTIQTAMKFMFYQRMRRRGL